MIQKIKAKLEEKYVPHDIIGKIVDAQSDEELLFLSHQMKARIEAIEHIQFEILSILKDEEVK